MGVGLMATPKKARKSIKQPARPKAVKRPVVTHKPIEAPLRKLVRTIAPKGAFGAPDVEPVPPVFSEPLPIPEPFARPDPPRPLPAPKPEPLPEPVEETVGALLTESWAHHVNRLAAMKRQDREGSQRCARLALECRQKAHRLDPEHKAVDWSLEQHKVKHRDTHDAMVEFYKAVLGV